MSRRTEQYRGRNVIATALAVKTGDYTVHVNVVKSGLALADDFLHESGQVFASEEDALEAGMKLGRSYVDAEIDERKK